MVFLSHLLSKTGIAWAHLFPPTVDGSGVVNLPTYLAYLEFPLSFRALALSGLGVLTKSSMNQDEPGEHQARRHSTYPPYEQATRAKDADFTMWLRLCACLFL
ncbi:hypothetical protein BDQ12DRAFT_726042 [Crucibulum laeve]|uniref:Uncharacterized protein n=1 Tax=Crucibulum laeve TaxID=68775 RepID=A0A5C3LU82_9AGAR|nr:hypothetical protein BDQ12DRAFT_726042 [Crucibulum laeve]